MGQPLAKRGWTVLPQRNRYLLFDGALPPLLMLAQPTSSSLCIPRVLPMFPPLLLA